MSFLSNRALRPRSNVIRSTNVFVDSGIMIQSVNCHDMLETLVYLRVIHNRRHHWEKPPGTSKSGFTLLFRLLCHHCSCSAGPGVSSCGRQRAEVPVTFITEQQNWRRRRHLWQPRSYVVVGGAFRTAHQRQSTGLERFIVVTYSWDGPVIVTVTLSETAWFHRGQVSQQKR